MTPRWLGYSTLVAAVSAAFCLVSVSPAAQSQNQAGGAGQSAQAPDRPGWAFPAPAPGFQPPKDDGSLRHVPGSAKGLTQTQINDPYNPPDWYPEDHPPLPEVVAHGKKPDVRACAQCHLANGLGHPESANLAGLPAAYIVQQMGEFSSGVRKGAAIMTTIAKGMTDEEIKSAANYFAGLPRKPWERVVEARTVPKTFVGAGNMRFVVKEGGGTEPIGARIIVVPEDEERAESRDSHSGFVDHVPAGSIKAGEALVTNGGNKTVRCGICHGPDLKGIGPVPGIAGRSPIYVVRQLHLMKDGTRAGLWTDLMKGVVAKLTLEDMVNIAAYTASRTP